MKKRIIALLLIAVLCISALTGCKKKPTSVSVIIGDIEITREEMMFYLAYYELLGNMYASYSGTAAETFWNSTDENNQINREVYYTTAFAEMSYMAIMSKLAAQENFSLTADKIAEADKDAEDFYNDFSADEKEKSGITLNGFKLALERQLLVTEFEKVFVKKLNVNEDKIKEGIKREDYLCKKTEFIGLSATKVNSEGKSEALSEEELKTAKENLLNALAKAKDGKSFEDIKTEEASNVTFTTGTKYMYKESNAEDAYKKAAENLEKDQFSDFVQGEQGLYIIKMVDTDCPDYYDNAVESAIASKEREEMSKYYETLSATYTRTIKDSIIPVEKFGSYFIIATEPQTK